jgi:hypothetical protein
MDEKSIVSLHSRQVWRKKTGKRGNNIFLCSESGTACPVIIGLPWIEVQIRNMNYRSGSEPYSFVKKQKKFEENFSGQCSHEKQKIHH